MSQNLSHQEVRRNIGRASLLMVASILLSRVIGFVREWVLAQSIGANASTDVYLASFTIPDFLNYLMAAGALSISFIPILSGYLARDEMDSARRVFRAVLSWFGALLIVLVLVGEFFAEGLARVVAPGFSPDQISLLATLLRIILPAQFFFYLGGLCMAVQQTHGRFLFPALAPIVYNVFIIMGGVLFHKQLGVAGFSVGVLVGGIVGQGLLQGWGVYKLGYRFSPNFRLDPETKTSLKRYLWLSLPLAFSFSLVVTDEWMSKYFASTLEPRALSWLSYARTEMRIPIAVLGQAAGVASFPYLSRLWSAGDRAQYARTFQRELTKLWALGPLAAGLLYIHADAVTIFIFGGSRFLVDDLYNTARALEMFSFGVFFWCAQVLLSRAFFACQITWLPSLMGGSMTLVMFPIYWKLSQEMGFRGLALAGSLGIALYCVILWVMLNWYLARHDARLERRRLYAFGALWTLGLLPIFAAAIGVRGLELAHHGRLGALSEVMLSGGSAGVLAYVLSRLIPERWTDGKLIELDPVVRRLVGIVRRRAPVSK